jgi:geranylgeranyl transferase type-2 subunit alpha
MSSFSPIFSSSSIAPNLSLREKVDSLRSEILKILEMLDGAEDFKWIYQSLIQLSMCYRDLSGSWLDETNSSHLQRWMNELEILDPLRKGRWKDIRKTISSSGVELTCNTLDR